MNARVTQFIMRVLPTVTGIQCFSPTHWLHSEIHHLEMAIYSQNDPFVTT